ncbi:MAG: DUF1801 domain-containing protein [Phycisphaerales bacterium]|nr:DUF1801 domain-containing protein [Phycisphaerales bacterium]
MQSKSTTVADYLASLPEDRRDALNAVRQVILKNLDKTFREGMQYGMIGYFVPHDTYPAGYHCDPKQPLPYAGLASQKGHMSLYLMGLYVGADAGAAHPDAIWFQKAWLATGKKLDMGKACVRFKKLDDLPLEVIGEAFRRLPAKVYIERYERVLGDRTPKSAKAPTSAAKNSPASPPPKKSAKAGKATSPKPASVKPAKAKGTPKAKAGTSKAPARSKRSAGS